MFFSIFILFIIFKYNIFTPVKGFGKQGIMNNVGGVLFFIIFSLIPLENLNVKILTFIIYLTRYTPGIYFLHINIYNIFKYKFYLIKHKTFFGCFLIYLICYSISSICFNLTKKTKLKYLFI